MKVFVAGTRGFPDIPGGVETHCQNLYPRLVRLGCKVTVFRRTPYLEKPRLKSFRGVRFIDLWCPRLKHLEAVVHTFLAVVIAALASADILHIHCSGPALFVPLARLLGLKVVLRSVGAGYERKNWGPFAKAVLRLGEKLGTRYANRNITITQHIQDSIRQKYGVESDLIPNGVEIPATPASAGYLRKWGLEKKKYAFTAGRFDAGKGFHELIEAFGGLPAEWKLVIAGQANHPSAYSQALEASARQTKGVVLTGFITGEELRQLFAHCGLFVLPSHHEGLSFAMLEALSYGNSVLLTDIPANKAIPLRPDRYFRAGDVEDLRQKMAYWMERGITDAEKEENLRMLRERHDWDVIAERTLAVYRSVLGLDA